MATSPATSPTEASPAAIDERRAGQLMERALALAERGDLQSSVLSCRQAVTLAPQSPQGYSMLGMLLERAGDAQAAITAYERVLQLAPDSVLERESLGRLRASATQRRNTRELFVFDDKELFDDERPEDLPTMRETPAASTPGEALQSESPNGIAAGGVAFNGASPVEEVRESVAPAAPDANTPAPPISAAAAQNAQADAVAAALAVAASTPASTPSGPAPAVSTSMPSASRARAANVPSATFDASVKPLSPIQKIMRRPSFYFRSAPLAGTTALSLVFLLWAHNQASSRGLNTSAPAAQNVAVVEEQPAPPVAPNPKSANPKSGDANTRAGQAGKTNAARSNAGASGLVPTNPGTGGAGAATPGASGAAPVAANPGASGPTNSGATSTPGGAVPTSPTAPAAGGGSPAVTPQNPATPATPGATARTAAGGNAGGGNTGAPAGGSNAGRAASGGSTGGTSTGSGPLNPMGSGDRNFVRVAPTGARPATRPDSRAASDERAAGTDARAGRPDAAVERITRSIESGGGDIALRYQQRAQLYLQSGDNARASSDFQSAISAYNEMLARGDRAAIARSGIQACQRGIQLANSRR